MARLENPPFSYGRFWSLTPVLTTPYAITVRSMGARPLMGRFSTSFMAMAWPADADTVCSGGASAVTVMLSPVAPTVS